MVVVVVVVEIVVAVYRTQPRPRRHNATYCRHTKLRRGTIYSGSKIVFKHGVKNRKNRDKRGQESGSRNRDKRDQESSARTVFFKSRSTFVRGLRFATETLRVN